MQDFARELKQLISVFEIKNSSLASTLGYDESYISKWLKGAALPGERSVRHVCESIASLCSSCCDNVNSQEFERFYGTADRKKLEENIFNILFAACKSDRTVVADSQEPMVYIPVGTVENAVNLTIFPFLTNITELDAAICTDILTLEHKQRAVLAAFGSNGFTFTENTPNVHLDMLLSLDSSADSIYDSLFIIHMMTSYSICNFNLYDSSTAQRSFIFAQKGTCAVTAGLSEMKAIGISKSQSANDANALFSMLEDECLPERLIFKPVSSNELITNHIYMRSLFSSGIRWLIGHYTEHFLPPHIFKRCCEGLKSSYTKEYIDEINRIGMILYSVCTGLSVNIMLYRSAVLDFVSTGEVDFFNNKIIMSVSERRECLQYLKALIEKASVNFKLIPVGFSDDFLALTNPNIFMSDDSCFLRLENGKFERNILLTENKRMKALLSSFFDDTEKQYNEHFVSDKDSIVSMIDICLERINGIE